MINLQMFIDMIKGGSQILSLERDYINDLNIFPVPDGDTGSNMDTTVRGAITSNIDPNDITSFKQFSQLFSKGLLMNARGNSGVIFSQIMRGFLSNFDEEVTELTPELLTKSFQLAKEKAYTSVVNPVEGTILTIIRMISEHLDSNSYTTVEDLFNDVVDAGQKALDITPDLLKELKEVGVVDSGGYGLLVFLKGMNAVLHNDLDSLIKTNQEELINKKGDSAYIDENNFKFFDQHKTEEGFGYCSEVIINLNLDLNQNIKEVKNNFDLEEFKAELLRIGNSLVCVQFDNLVKVHIHTMKPYRLLQIAQQYGEFEKIKIENMSLQYEQKVSENKNSHSHASEFNFNDVKLVEGLSIIATAPTSKIAKFIKEDFEVDDVIVTEDKGAPSLQTFLTAMYNSGKKNCLIITDDSNLVMAANGAKDYTKDIKCEVIPAKNIFETIVSASNVNKDISLKNNQREITKILNKTLSAVISTSIKDVNYSHIDVKQNNKIGIINKKIVVAVQDEFAALKLTLDKLISGKKGIDICFLVYGANANLNTINQFEKYVSEKYGLYCEVRSGDQKVYDYYIGLQ